jgi:hypothetical protein
LTIEFINQDLVRRVRDAVGRLMVHSALPDGKVHLGVPVCYPSGSCAVVDIERNGDRIWVSDMGMGLVEAEMMGARESYQHLARGKAGEFGVDYDGNAIFVLWAPIDRLEAAVICVANASAQAAADAVRNASELSQRRQEDKVFERVRSVFGNQSVARTRDIAGKRTSWEAHNVVVLPNARCAIFEPMSKHPNSVSSKFLMFSDLRAADLPISLNAVVEDIGELDAKAQMIGDIANIVELRSSDETFRRYGAAA